MANAIASVSFETDCMIADTIGMFNLMDGSSPFENFVMGAARSTFSGKQSLVVRFGSSKYSLKVLETSE